jgi:hypothetical protein
MSRAAESGADTDVHYREEFSSRSSMVQPAGRKEDFCIMGSK